MNTGHTPGTWKAEGWEAVTINAHDPSHPQGFVTIVACPGGSDQTTLREMQANARLISAAPELLDTLERFVTACHAYLPETTDQAFCGLYASTRAAIARATGAAQ